MSSEVRGESLSGFGVFGALMEGLALAYPLRLGVCYLSGDCEDNTIQLVVSIAATALGVGCFSADYYFTRLVIKESQ